MTPLAATEAERLTLEQCDEFRRHPGTFNQMVQAIYDAGQARVLQQTAEPVADPRLEDLRYIVKRLARKLAKADPNSGEPSGALIYLRRVGLIGSPLRAAPDRAPSTDSAAVDYKLLLAKYIEHVGAEEGTTFIGRLCRNSSGGWEGYSDKVVFSQLEKEALEEDFELPPTK